ncbi:transposase InsO family protein [Novosphingobium sp. 1748]|uniref:transposase domain-containing protein n=1 Tax=Novosphingobium sp. 1748 TaxID=2817760 RepID=UPI0028571AEA|nr:transposase domain-containing protein [Novosphingobium sp. 1748]MDR6708141.1 transposase InsO family protein [Novosphingobium sp. 1748]
MGAAEVIYPKQFAQPQSGPKEWFSAVELAELRLPGLPSDKRSMQRRAVEERWGERRSLSGELLSRTRSGRGGGLEFNIQVLPAVARQELVRRGICAETTEDAVEQSASEALWEWFGQQPGTVKEEAQKRLDAMVEISLLHDTMKVSKHIAVRDVAEKHQVSQATLWNWCKAVSGVERKDWLAALAPRRKGGGKKAEIPEELWQLFKSDWLRLSAPPLAASYNEVKKQAKVLGVSLPSVKAFQRKLAREIDPYVVILMREGPDALERRVPSIRRTVDDIQVMEWVNIDGHVFDVEVKHPDTGKVIRPTLVALQDIRSSKMLSWRVGISESAATVRLVFADMIRDFGIPADIILDNGRGFAAKWLTGGALTRYRFKILPEDPQGLLVQLGTNIHWATPFHGQAKPIERAWGDLCNYIAKSAEFDGAYTGNSPVNKPANRGSRAIEWQDFCAVVDRVIAEHNAREGRTGRDYKGRSFDQVFAEGWANTVIKKPSRQQLRDSLLAVERKRGSTEDGEITLFGNRYWTTECREIAGKYVTVRFDPDDLHSEIHIYGENGAFLFTAPIMEDFGFKQKEGATVVSKRRAHARKLARMYAEAEDLLDPAEVARIKAGLPSVPQPELGQPAATRVHVVRSAAEPKPASEVRASTSQVFAALPKPRLVK